MIKECPKCKSGNIVTDYLAFEQYQARCRDCGIQTKIHKTNLEARQDWNRREDGETNDI